MTQPDLAAQTLWARLIGIASEGQAPTMAVAPASVRPSAMMA